MKNFAEYNTPDAVTRPRWRTPQLTSDSIGISTRDDNPPGAPFDGFVSYGTAFHENS